MQKKGEFVPVFSTPLQRKRRLLGPFRADSYRVLGAVILHVIFQGFFQGNLHGEGKQSEQFRLFAGAGGGMFRNGLEDRLYADRLDGLLIHAPTGLHADRYFGASSLTVTFQYRIGPWLAALDGQTLRSRSHHAGSVWLNPASAPSLEVVQGRHSRWNAQLVGGYSPFSWASNSVVFLIGFDFTGAYTQLERARLSQGGRSEGDRIDLLHTGRLVGLEYRFENERFGIQARYLYQYSPYGRWESERKTFYLNGQMEIYSELGPIHTEGHRAAVGFDYALSPAWMIRFQYTAGLTKIYDHGLNMTWTGTRTFQPERYVLNRLLGERTAVNGERFSLFEMGIVYRWERK